MQDSPLLEQLDWFFTSLNWATVYPATFVEPQGKPVSDHTPCVVSIQTKIPASKIFRFENYWVAHEGFLDMVKNSWSKPTFKKNSASNLNAKLKRLRYDIKHWSKNISKLTICIDNSNKALMEIDKLEEARPLSTPEKNFRKILKDHLIQLLGFQQQYWRKRCTIRWTKFGDENSKFFQSIATERYRRNYIAALPNADGIEVTSHEAKEKIIFDTYKQRLGSSTDPPMVFDLPSLIQPLPGLEVLSLPFTKEEIDKVVKEMPADKAPGPDGFNGQFLKSCWHIIKEDIYTLCNDFHEGKLDLESINMGHITLIPKTNSPEGINDYRPITLLNCCLKLITKLLADRLQKKILSLVHKNQYGFLKGRNIQDCLAWAFEFIHQCQASKQKIILLKLDFAKAFDTIDHGAMLKILAQMGFDERWIGWIKMLFSSGKSAILLNGVPGRQFFCKRGVRQGDPLSPLLFVLAADILQSAINKAFRNNLIAAPFPPDFNMDFPIIQYADDTLIIMPACINQVNNMKKNPK